MWIWIVVGVLVVLVGIWVVATYNGFVKLRNIVEESWRQIDVELHRRYDLIPNLVETVKGYAAHERQTFENVTAARAAAMAQRHKIWLAGSMLEALEGRYYNTLAVWSPEGTLAAVYRKTHLFRLMQEEQYLAPGPAAATVELPSSLTLYG